MSENPTPTEPLQPSRADLLTLDILAYQLYLKNANGPSIEEWQNSAEVRRTMRGVANDLIGCLAACGVDVVLRRQKQADKFIAEITTIPAKKAYEPGQE
jgi:hypothetical protein